MKIRAGFTLTEILLYMGLLSIFLLVLTEIFTSTLSLKLESESASFLTQDARFILSRLAYEVGRAESVTIPGSVGEQTNTLEFIADGITYTYLLDAGNLLLNTGEMSYKLNGLDTSLESISFKRVGNLGGKHTFQVTFSLSSDITEAGGRRSQTFQTTVGLR